MAYAPSALAHPARTFLFPPRSCMISTMGDGNAFADRDRLAGLLVAVGAGDRAAFAQLYRSSSAKLYGICLRMLGSEAEAQEVLQEAYVTIWRRASAFDPAKAGAITWLAVLARNKAIDRLRLRRPSSEPIEAAERIADESPSALDLLEAAGDRERLFRCLDELEDRQRLAIRAAFLEGATYPDLSRRHEVPLGTMKSWIRRGLIRLRGCLER
jgi:RNA polymerase sigma factor (sigma-70 family)